jgi:hypothetical protein
MKLMTVSDLDQIIWRKVGKLVSDGDLSKCVDVSFGFAVGPGREEGTQLG